MGRLFDKERRPGATWLVSRETAIDAIRFTPSVRNRHPARFRACGRQLCGLSTSCRHQMQLVLRMCGQSAACDAEAAPVTLRVRGRCDLPAAGG